MGMMIDAGHDLRRPPLAAAACLPSPLPKRLLPSMWPLFCGRQGIPMSSLDAAALARRLHSPRRTEQLKAVCSLEQLLEAAERSGNTAACDQLVAAGCIPPLVKMLSSGSQPLQALATRTLIGLTAGSERAREAGAAAIPALVDLLNSSEAPEKLIAQLNAVSVLDNVAGGSGAPARGAAIVAAGGHTALLQLSASASALVRAASCRALINLAGNLGSRQALMDVEAFSALVAVLRGSSSGSDGAGSSYAGTAAAHAAAAIGNLCSREPGTLPAAHPTTAMTAAAQAATAAGAPEALVQLLRCTRDDSVLREAVRAVSNLIACNDPAVSGAVAAAGGIQTLAQHLCSGSCSPGVLSRVLRVLAGLADGSAERGAALAATPGVLQRLVQLLGAAAAASDDTPFEAASTLVAMLWKDSAGEAAAAAAVAAGVAPALVAALRATDSSDCPETDAPHLAYNLAACGQAAALLEAGAAPLLRRLTASAVPAVGEAAADALELLASPAAQGSSAAAPAATKPASGLQQRRQRACDAPGCSATHGLRFCGGCGSVRYCSQDCSRAHWKAHRAECRRLQAEQAAAAASDAPEDAAA